MYSLTQIQAAHIKLQGPGVRVKIQPVLLQTYFIMEGICCWQNCAHPHIGLVGLTVIANVIYGMFMMLLG